MNLREIKVYSRESRAKINKVAESIHPKLLKILQYNDLYDESLRDNGLIERFNRDVHPLIEEFHSTFKNMKHEYLYNFFDDFLELDDYDDIGIDLFSGQYLYKPDSWVSAIDFLPNPACADIYNGVINLHQNYMGRLKPFWEYNSYTITSDTQHAVVSSNSSPVRFIDNARSQFKDGHVNAIQRVVECAKMASEFDYPIHYPPLSPYDEKNIHHNVLIRSVERHAKLRDFLESTHVNEEGNFYSTLSNGKYKFKK